MISSTKYNLYMQSKLYIFLEINTIKLVQLLWGNPLKVGLKITQQIE